MVAIAEGQFLENADFQTRLGIDRRTLGAILSDPDFDYRSDDPDVNLAINNCMNEIAHGVRIPPAEWGQWFAVPLQEVKRTFLKWQESRERTSEQP
jgi:hypothetical protein